jgi:hypothetical protein
MTGSLAETALRISLLNGYASLVWRLHHICDYIISLLPLVQEPEYLEDTTAMLARQWKGLVQIKTQQH